MDLIAFHKLRNGIQGNVCPGSLKELKKVEKDLRAMLMTSGIFEDVAVEHTSDPDRLVIALCRFAPEYSEQDIAEVMEWMWQDRVSYPYWEAHALRVDMVHVEFQPASRNGDSAHCVTVHMVAEKLHIPAQRPPVD
jgi:hypothetical protein